MTVTITPIADFDALRRGEPASPPRQMHPVTPALAAIHAQLDRNARMIDELLPKLDALEAKYCRWSPDA
jgi:hypothetical protein